jgi:hypothetical protein
MKRVGKGEVAQEMQDKEDAGLEVNREHEIEISRPSGR